MAQYVNIAAVEFRTVNDEKRYDRKDSVLAGLDEAFDTLTGLNVDLVVFSEGVEAVGQTNETAEQIHEPGPFLSKYRDFSRSEQCFVVGSIKRRHEERVFNSLVIISPSGEMSLLYDKANLTYREIGTGMSPGNGARVIDTPVGRLGGIVCFDLNFEWLRFQYRKLRPDILCFSSSYHGGFMQALWAYECRAFFISALTINGCGILDPLGTTLKSTHCYSSIARETVNLDRVVVHLDLNRQKFPEIERTYGEDVEIRIPPNLGAALISSRSTERTAQDVVKEFELELLDDYFARSLADNGRCSNGEQ